MEENSMVKNIGEVCIADEVVAVIAGLAAAEGVDSMAGKFGNELASRLALKNAPRGAKVEVTEEHVSVDLSIIMKYGYSIPKVTREVQEKVVSAIENMTGLKVIEVNVSVVGVNIE
mgnify:CR=1 FL=1